MGYKYRTNVQKQKKAEKNYEKRGRGPTVCQKRNFGKPCKYCAKVDELKSEDYDANKEIIGKCFAKSTFYFNVIDLNAKDDGIQVYGCGVENWRTMIDFLPDSDGDGVDFTDPDEARALLIKRTGTGLSTKYSLKLSEKSYKIKQAWLDDMVQLHNILSVIEDEDVKIWKPKEGKNSLLILPPWGKEADGDFYFEVFYHWNSALLDNLISQDEDDDDDESTGESVYSDEDFEEDGVDVDVDEDDEDEDPDEDGDDKFSEMSRKEIIQYIKSNKLKIKTVGKDTETLKDEVRDLEDDIPY